VFSAQPLRPPNPRYTLLPSAPDTISPTRGTRPVVSGLIAGRVKMKPKTIERAPVLKPFHKQRLVPVFQDCNDIIIASLASGLPM
jgi:hypothetical protein